jgi:hypothetical protein
MGVVGVALGAVAGHAVAAAVGLALVVRHFGGVERMRALVNWARVRDATALIRLFALSRDLTIRSAALMSAFAYFTAQTARVGEVSLASNAVLMQFLMISAFFLDGQGQAAEQLCGKAVGANYRPGFERALALTLGWGLAVSVAMFALADQRDDVECRGAGRRAPLSDLCGDHRLHRHAGLRDGRGDERGNSQHHHPQRHGGELCALSGAGAAAAAGTGGRRVVDRDQHILRDAGGDLLWGHALEAAAAISDLRPSRPCACRPTR